MKFPIYYLTEFYLILKHNKNNGLFLCLKINTKPIKLFYGITPK